MTKIYDNLLAVIILIAFTFTANAQDLSRKINTLLKTYYSFDVFNGCVLVSEGDKILYQGAFGKADFEWGIANSIDTKFEIASLSKEFTAIIILQMVEIGTLKLEGKISDYLPDFPKDKGDKITIHQILSHTSGLTDTRFINNFDREYGTQSKSHEEYINLFIGKDLLFEPGTQFSYSNFGYNLLAYLAEKIYKKPFREILREKIFAVAGMNNSLTLEEFVIIPKLAKGYEKRFGDIQKAHYHAACASFGSGSVITTVGDYFLFQRALKKGKLLTEKYVNILFTPYTRASGELTGYSLWYDSFPLGASDTLSIIRSAGNHFGVRTLSYYMKKEDKHIVMFQNVANPRMFEIADNMTKILFNVPFESPKDTYARVLFTDIEQKGLAFGLKHYSALKKKNSCTQQFRDFNRLGYYYIDKGKYNIAKEIFTLNIEAFPTNPDGYDSLGEAYMMLGDKEPAMKNYQKSLELDPKNSNAAQMINKLKAN